MRVGLELIEDRKQRETFKHFLRKHFNQGAPRKVFPLTEISRTRVEDETCGEYWVEYGFFDGTDFTDDEVQARIDAMRYIIRSPYDCTGCTFTRWIDWHRNPSGLISYRHYKGLDI